MNDWSEVEFSAEEEDSGAVVFEAFEASRHRLDRLDFAVDPFAECIGDVVTKVGENIGEMVRVKV